MVCLRLCKFKRCNNLYYIIFILRNSSFLASPCTIAVYSLFSIVVNVLFLLNVGLTAKGCEQN